MKPMYFGPRARQLFGLYHAAVVPHDASGGLAPVVLIEPFGHEAIRTHRFYRVLADRLVRGGHPVFRFSTYGAGDSAGDDLDVELGGWVEDLLAAHGELGRLCGAEPGCWMGARLGASVAIQASRVRLGKGGSPHRLVLWDPIIDGLAYLDLLRYRHVDALEASFNLPHRSWREQLADRQAYADEAIGFGMSASLRAEIAALAPSALAVPNEMFTTLVLSPENQTAVHWAKAQSPPAAVSLLEQRFEWTSDDSLNTALVPADAMSQVLRAIHG